MADTAIVDIDGTLVDSNYHHALAWFRAFGRFGLTYPVWHIHRQIGMGGDQLVEAVAGPAVEKLHGDDIRDAWVEEFEPTLTGIKALEGASVLLEQLCNRSFRVVLASSGKPEHVEHYLDLIDARRYAAAWTTAEDVESTKPAPDLLRVALEKVGGRHAVVVGDSPWDFVAAEELGAPTIALRSGGFADSELIAAGADRVFDSPADLIEHLGETELRRAS